MNKTAKTTRNIGLALAAIGIIGIVASFILDTGSEIGFRLITAAFLFYIPGILLWVLGYLLGELDERISSLEQKIHSFSERSSQSKASP